MQDIDSFSVDGLTTSTMIVEAGFIPPFFPDSSSALSPILNTLVYTNTAAAYNISQVEELNCAFLGVPEGHKV